MTLPLSAIPSDFETGTSVCYLADRVHGALLPQNMGTKS
jgi:hypothetical protein